MDSDCPDGHSPCVDDVIDEWTVPQHFGSQAFRSVIFVWWKPHWVMKEQVWFFMVKRCPITLHVLGTNRPGCSMAAFLLWSSNIIINDTILSGVQCRWHSLHDTHEERFHPAIITLCHQQQSFKLKADYFSMLSKWPHWLLLHPRRALKEISCHTLDSF